MDKFTSFAQDSAGNVITTGTPTIRVTLANSDTLASIYSSDSLSAPKANPFTLPASGKIEFHARNGKYRVKMINGAVETPIEEVMMFAGISSGALAGRPTAGSTDKFYAATDVGKLYRDNGTTWEEYPGTGAIGAANLASSSLNDGCALLNGTLTAVTAGNALTIAVKTLAGTDPSAADPVAVIFRNPTIATGDYSVLLLTAATSFVVSSGSTLGVGANNIAFRGWIVGFNDAGTFRLGVINCVTTSAGAGAGRNVDSIYPLAQVGIASSTAEGGAGAADSAEVFYTGVAVAAKAYKVLGYFTYEAGLAAIGTWAVNPTRLERFTQNVPLPGQVIQTVRSQSGAVATGTTAVPDDDTIPQGTEGDQYMSRAITPSSAANALEIEHVGQYAHSGTVALIVAALFQDATANALATMEGGRDSVANARTSIKLLHRILAGLTTATTMKIRAGNSTGATTTFNGAAAGRKYGGVMASYLQINEVMG